MRKRLDASEIDGNGVVELWLWMVDGWMMEDGWLEKARCKTR